MNDKEMYDIVDKYGLPRDEVSCPSCSRIYGAYKRKVCISCEECSKCCECKEPNYTTADDFVANYVWTKW